MSVGEEGKPGRDEWAAGERRILWRVLALTLPLTITALLALPNYGPVLRIYNTDANSMAPTISAGGSVMVSRAAYGYSRHSFDSITLPIQGRFPDWQPARGDIIVFRLPRRPTTKFARRVVGLPGDKIAVTNGRLTINGAVVPRESQGMRPYPGPKPKTVPAYLEKLPGGPSYTIFEVDGDNGPLDNTTTFLVPPRHLFVLGDNRDNSADSRVSAPVGFLPMELVVGKVVFTK